MKRLVAALATVIICGVSLSASAQLRTDRMTDLMAHVPANWVTDSGAFIGFSDAEASLAATVRSPAGLLAGMFGGGNPTAPYLRLVTVPWSITSAVPAGINGEWQTRVGFEPAEIAALLSAQWSRNEVILFEFADDTDHNTIGQALLANDYQASSLGDWSTWWRGEDYAIDGDVRDPANPFGGDMGRSSRVASNGEVLVSAPGWPPIQEVAGPPNTTIVDLPEIASITAALNDPRFGDARLVQAMVLPQTPTVEDGSLDPVLPPWRFGMLADLSSGLVDYGVAVIVFDDPATAEGLTDPLLNAWQTMRSVEHNVTFSELTGGDAAVFVVGEGPAALVLAIERPMEGEQEYRNLVFQSLYEAYITNDLSLLATE